MSAPAKTGAPRLADAQKQTGAATQPAAPNQPAPRFGPAGRGDSFKTLGLKSGLQIVDYVRHFGLDAYEYQAGHGVRLNPETGRILAQKGREANVAISLHAPYYISTSSLDEEKRLGSLRYFLQSAQAVDTLGGSRVIFHCGGAGKQTRAEAFARTADTLARARQLLDDEGYAHINLCPETMGKLSQLGTLEEVLALCQADARHIPCIDFGHLNARSQGAFTAKKHFEAVAAAIGEALSDARAKSFHVHFSKIEYTAGGEKHHLTFADRRWGPRFEPFIEACADLRLAPTVICESRGTQAEDAQKMQKYYNKYIHKNNIQKG